MTNCSDCRQELPFWEFLYNPTKERRLTCCVQCANSARRRRYARDAERKVKARRAARERAQEQERGFLVHVAPQERGS